MSSEKKFFLHLLNCVAIIFDGFALILFVALIILATLQILFRYVFMYPLPWTEELARFTLVWVTFLGAASATRRKLHLAVDFFINKLNPRAAKFITFFFYILILGFLVIILYGALVMMGEAKPIFAGSITWLSMMYLYLGPVIGLVLMIIFVGANLYQLTWASEKPILEG
ncbi:MAG: TRAP transporter small permease [Thermodesulfobacteriota bacterium]